MLVEKKRTSKWLSEQLGKDPATISKWCTNTSQPDLVTLTKVAALLDVDVRQLINKTKGINTGGGAMLFYMLQQHPNIKRAVINDINSDLITCYRTVRDNVEELIPALQDIQAQYYALQDMDAKREMFIAVRQRYNEKNLGPIENTVKFFFLNRTCFNGLYRVNKKGLFNVPCGKYMQPQIYTN